MINKRWNFWLTVAILFFVFLYLIRSILLPFVLGIFIAYFIHPAVDKLEKNGLSRGVSTLVIMACFFLSIILLCLLVVPIIASQLSGLILALPDYVAIFDQKYMPLLSHWLGDIPTTYITSGKAAISDFSGMMVKFAGDFLGGIFRSGMAIVTALSLILITPIVAFYLLRDWKIIVMQIDELLPRNWADTIRTQLIIIDRTLAGFVRGQLNVCLLLGAFYAIGLSLTGLKFGIVIGLATGFLVIFPYVGFMLCMTIGMGVAFFQFDSQLDVMMVFIVFMIGQVLESYFVTPKLVGEKVGLHPVWIIFGMLSGAALFGFVGVLLALPATAIIGVLIRFALQHYLQSSYYQGERPLIKPKL